MTPEQQQRKNDLLTLQYEGDLTKAEFDDLLELEQLEADYFEAIA